MAVYDNSLTAQHISANPGMWEAARTPFFTLIVDDIDNIVRANYSSTDDSAEPGDEDRIANAQEYLKLSVVSASVPHFSLSQLEYTRGNEKVKFAGVPTFDSGSIKVDDVIGLDTKSILMAWQGLAYNVHTRKGGSMAEYKKTCTLIEYNQKYEQVRS